MSFFILKFNKTENRLKERSGVHIHHYLDVSMLSDNFSVKVFDSLLSYDHCCQFVLVSLRCSNSDVMCLLYTTIMEMGKRQTDHLFFSWLHHMVHYVWHTVWEIRIDFAYNLGLWNMWKDKKYVIVRSVLWLDSVYFTKNFLKIPKSIHSPFYCQNSQYFCFVWLNCFPNIIYYYMIISLLHTSPF